MDILFPEDTMYQSPIHIIINISHISCVNIHYKSTSLLQFDQQLNEFNIKN